VVVGRNGADLFLVPIFSVLPNTDFPLAAWRAAGLNVPSGVKAQLATVEERLVLKVVGTLSPADCQTLDQHLRYWLKL
jgi:hypothetical protein